MHWLWIHAGLSSPNSPWYLFWSGFGADWTRILTIFGLLHVGRRMSRHHTEHHKEQKHDEHR